MATVKLTRRWGSHPEGDTVEVDDTMAKFLTDTAFAVRPGDEDRNRHGSARVYPGENGPDPRAGGDGSRHRMTGEVKSPRGGERAGRIAGAPRAVGDVTHVAPENLGKEHKGDGGDVLLASGKTLREDLEDEQRELDKRDAKRQSEQGQSQREQAEQGAGATVKTESAPQASGESQPEGRRLTQPGR